MRWPLDEPISFRVGVRAGGVPVEEGGLPDPILKPLPNMNEPEFCADAPNMRLVDPGLDGVWFAANIRPVVAGAPASFKDEREVCDGELNRLAAEPFPDRSSVEAGLSLDVASFIFLLFKRSSDNPLVSSSEFFCCAWFVKGDCVPGSES